MKKLLIIIISCMLLTACGTLTPEENGNTDSATKDTGSATDDNSSNNEEGEYMVDKDLSHVMGKLVDSQKDYYIFQVVGETVDSISGNFYITADASLFNNEKTEWAVIEYSGTAEIIGKAEQEEKLSEELYNMLPDDSFFLLPEKIEKADWVENDGILKGTLASLEMVLNNNNEITDGYNSVRPLKDEYEGNGVLIGYYTSKTEISGALSLGSEIIVYYDPDTLEVSKVEAVLKE